VAHLDVRHAWPALCAALALVCLVLFWQTPTGTLAWSAPNWPRQPWTLWTAAWLHLSAQHLGANLLALAALAWLGHLLAAGPRCVAAVLLAWPLGTWALSWWSEVQEYRGLSGLMHSMLAVLSVEALRRRDHRRWGYLLATGLLLKLAWEQAWNLPVVWDADWGFNVVRAAHLSGAATGCLVALLIRPRRPGSS